MLLAVRDEGPGIDRQYASRIFEPFFTTKGPRQGTGLGLTVCRSIVEQCGGRMEVESPPGLGATFKVWLPVTALT